MKKYSHQERTSTWNFYPYRLRDINDTEDWKMKLQNKQRESRKVNELLETMMLLGIGAKSIKINFDELRVHLSVHNKENEMTCTNHKFKKTFDSGQKKPSLP